MATMQQAHITLKTGAPLKVGQVFARKGTSAIFRVIGPDNLVERFDGNRRERARQLAEWKALVPKPVRGMVTPCP